MMAWNTSSQFDRIETCQWPQSCQCQPCHDAVPVNVSSESQAVRERTRRQARHEEQTQRYQSDRFRGEIDGLRAGVELLAKYEQPVVESMLGETLDSGRSSREYDLGVWGQREWEQTDGNLDESTGKQIPSEPSYSSLDTLELIIKYDPLDYQIPSDETPELVASAYRDPWKVPFDPLDEIIDFSEASGALDSTLATHLMVEDPSESSSYSVEGGRDATNQQSAEKPSISPECCEPFVSTRKLPQQSQWATLRELHQLSKQQYSDFLRLTAGQKSRGIKILRRMYGSSRGMFDTGITTFSDVLDGKEPHSLKQIFAFTCLSHTVATLLQNHGLMNHFPVQVLADTNRWRLAIRKEGERAVYDQAVKLLWPEIDFLEEASKCSDILSMPPSPESYQDSYDSIYSAMAIPLRTPLSLLEDALSLPADFDLTEMIPATKYSGSEEIQSSGHGLEDHLASTETHAYTDSHGLYSDLMKLFQETSSHDDFMFADFLNLNDPQTKDGVQIPEFGDQSLDTMSTMQQQKYTSQMIASGSNASSLDPGGLLNSLPAMLNQPNSLSSPDGNIQVPSLLEPLSDTSMFRVVAAFIKFVASLGELLYQLSGCGITSRRHKYETEDGARPFQDLGEFITGAAQQLLAPLRDELGETDESIDAVLCMTDTFVRLGRLQTVREIQDYIITTARHISSDYKSFMRLVTRTLKRCLCASLQLPWDHIYPNCGIDQEDYSTIYIKKRELEEIRWASQNLNSRDKGKGKCTDFAISSANSFAGPSTQRQEVQFSSSVERGFLRRALYGGSSFTPESIPSPANHSPSSSSPRSNNGRQSSANPASSSESEISSVLRVHCHYASCKKLYTGKEARVNLRRHVRTMHEESKMTTCPKCGHESARRDNVRKHFLSKHRGEKLPAALMCRTRT